MEKNQPYVLLTILLASASVHAQKTPDLAADEVVVTATRFEDRSTQQPVNVQTINAAQIRESGARTLPELLSQQAGIYTRDSSGNPNRQIDMRGFGTFGDQNTLVLVDGLRISENEQTPANITAIPLSSIERIEIIRGSGGAVLYGNGATGGTIHIVTKGPVPGDRQAQVKAAYGSYSTEVFAVGASIAGEKMGLKLDADRFDSDNYRANNEITQKNAHVDARYFGDHGPIALKFTHSEQDLRLPGSRTEAQMTTDRRGTATPNDYGALDADKVLLSTTQTYRFGQLGVDIGYRERHLLSVLQPGFIDTHGRVTNVSPRLKLPFEILGRNNALVVGLDWEQWDYDSSAFFGFSSAAISTQDNRAIYLKDTFELTESTLLSIGAREQHSETTLEEVGSSPEQVQNKTLHAYDFALRQALTKQWAAYVRAGASFRLANVDDNRFLPTLLEPQKSHDQEAGVDFAAGRAWLRAAIYRMHLNNEILFLPSTVLPPFGGNVNLPPTERKGVELDADFMLSESLTLRTNYTLAIARFRDGNFGGVDVSGNNLPLVPRHRANAALTWGLVQRASITGRVSYVGEQYFENDQSNAFGRKMPAYTVADLIGGVQIGSWRLGAAVYNLFNQKYFSYGVVSGASFVAYPAALRSFLVSAEYRFGD